MVYGKRKMNGVLLHEQKLANIPLQIKSSTCLLCAPTSFFVRQFKFFVVTMFNHYFVLFIILLVYHFIIFLCAILLIFCVLFNHHSSFVFFHHLFLRSSIIFGVRFYIFSIFLLCALQLFFSSL